MSMYDIEEVIVEVSPDEVVEVIAETTEEVIVETLAGEQGVPGPTNVISQGSTTIVDSTQSPSFTLSGTSPSQTLSFTLPKGTQILSGSSAPTGGTGSNGDYYINTSTWDMSKKVSGTWSTILNIRGATGPAPNLSLGTVSTGAEGASGSATVTGTNPNYLLNFTLPVANSIKWYTGSGTPSTGLGSVNDMYIITSGTTGLGDLYKKTGTSTWTLQGNIRGASGAGNVSYVNGISPDGTGNVTLSKSNLVHDGYTATATTAAGDYAKICTISSTSASSNAIVKLHVAGVDVTGPNYFADLVVGFRANSGYAVSNTIDVIDSLNITSTDFYAVVTNSGSSPVTIELYIKRQFLNIDYQYRADVYANTSSTVTFEKNSAWSSTIPTGTPITIKNHISYDYSSGKTSILGLNVSGTTSTAIASVFAGNTNQSIINFDKASGSLDYGRIIHETSSTQTDNGVLHLMPSDDNNTADYVSIHGIGQSETTKLFTGGRIETPGPLVVSGSISGSTFTGSGSGLTSLNASNVSSGTLNVARLGSNTPSKPSWFYAGDGTWTSPSRVATAVSTGSGASNANKWTKFASITITAQYNDSCVALDYVSGQSGYENVPYGNIFIRVKQQNPLGGLPIISLQTSQTRYLRPSFFVACISQNDASATVVDFYYKHNFTYQDTSFYEQSARGPGQVTYYSYQPFLTSDPTPVSGSLVYGEMPKTYAGTDGFRLVSQYDESKIVAFNNDSQTAWTTRTITFPDSSGTLALSDATNTFSTRQIFSNTGYLDFFNTTDQTTNYEKVIMQWSGNVFNIQNSYSGTGTTRDIRISNSNSYMSITPSGVLIGRDSTAVAEPVVIGSTGLVASNVVQNMLSISPVVNQSGTAGYTMLKINPSITATGSGTKLLMDIGLSNSTKFSVDTSGNIVSTGTITSTSITANGSGLTNLNASNIATGTLSDSRLSSNVAKLNASQTFTGTNTFANTIFNSGFTIQVAGNSGIEIGRNDGFTNTPFIDFHSSGASIDYDARIIVSGGDGINNGTGNIKIQASTAEFTGDVAVPGTKTIVFGNSGSNPPTTNTTSAGTKVILYPALSSTNTDYAIGIEPSNVWFSAPTTGHGFKWYGGTTQIASLSGTGTLTTTLFSGSGASLTSLNGSNISSGTVPFARLPTGTTSSTIAIGNHTHDSIVEKGSFSATVTPDSIPTGMYFTQNTDSSWPYVNGTLISANANVNRVVQIYAAKDGTESLYWRTGTSASTWTAWKEVSRVGHTHAASDITSGTLAYARLPVGTTASTVAAGDDSRIVNAASTTYVTNTINDNDIFELMGGM